jgi:hypothetical protein
MIPATAARRPAMPIVAPEHFLLATRDTGYRSVAAAVAELVDNSLQAGARRIQVLLRELGEPHGPGVFLGVLDDGEGMSPDMLECALQFGGTNRFGDRSGLGRFGMGLPNSSVSQARRFAVYSWQRPGDVYYTYLDVDEVVGGRLRHIPKPHKQSLPGWVVPSRTSHSGTLVLWTRCDRLARYRLETLVQKMERTLGRVYRYAIWNGKRLDLNGTSVQPFDPLFVDSRAALRGARWYGAPLKYELRTTAGTSTIEVQFSELPVDKWHSWPTEEKRRTGIVGCAGMSVVRAGREIDYGWYLFGSKRRENYDDWWRCELKFSPELDELFGVTHSKQGVTPRTELKLLVSSDLEAIARTLNRRVRHAFDRAKSHGARPPAAVAASRGDTLLVPPASLASRSLATGGIRYRLEYKPIPEREFYAVRLSRGSIVVTVNTNHPFFTDIYLRASTPRGCGHDRLERLILAAARADLEARGARERAHTIRLRRAWSDALAAFLRR